VRRAREETGAGIIIMINLLRRPYLVEKLKFEASIMMVFPGCEIFKDVKN
jgi:hypothetical protein